MDALIGLVIAVFAGIGVMAVFDLIADAYGADSRPTYGDDHARSV